MLTKKREKLKRKDSDFSRASFSKASVIYSQNEYYNDFNSTIKDFALLYKKNQIDKDVLEDLVRSFTANYVEHEIMEHVEEKTEKNIFQKVLLGWQLKRLLHGK